MHTILEVALPVNLYATFDYLIPAHLSSAKVQPGMRVNVPFRNRELIGICMGTKATSNVPANKLKSISQLIDTQPCLPMELMELCQWAARYYVHPLGEVFSQTLPKRLRDGLEEYKNLEWQHTSEGKGLPEDALKRAPKQQQLHQLLLSKISVSDAALKAAGITSSTLKAVQEKGLIHQLEVAPEHSTNIAKQLLATPPLALNPEQSRALEALRYHQFNCQLLEGITGSGKTEIYLQAVARVLQTGKQALVLVPEIGLTPQTVTRFRQRFTVDVVELHSNVSELEREKNWLAARSGSARIVVGTRLASLCPMANLGIIIVDEEHDASYKQQDSFRYSARDLSIYRAKQIGIPIILGSATPSLETLNNGFNGRYQHLRLTKRVGQSQAPHLELIDLRNQNLMAGLSPRATEAIQQTLDQGQQAMVFMNRRGYATALQCHSCGWTAVCPSCDAKMTLHKHPHHLRCHHCNRQRGVPKKCPSCNSNQLLHRGLGTEQLEQALTQQYPDNPVIRIDRDSTSRKNAFAEALNTLNKGEPCIAVGTQMLAKGHHLPKVTLVIIIDADQGMLSADFRGTEKLGQLIIQVAGRAGRETHNGRVLIQSHTPEHPLLELLLKQGYNAFARHLLEQRSATQLPPFSHLAIFRAESKRPQNAVELLEQVRNLCQSATSAGTALHCLGPLPALVERVQDRYRYQLQVFSPNRAQLNQRLTQVTTALSDLAIAKRTRWSLDVDGVE